MYHYFPVQFASRKALEGYPPPGSSRAWRGVAFGAFWKKGSKDLDTKAEERFSVGGQASRSRWEGRSGKAILNGHDKTGWHGYLTHLIRGFPWKLRLVYAMGVAAGWLRQAYKLEGICCN